MDLQISFNIAVALAGFLGGWVLNSISRKIDRLDEDVRDMPQTFVFKEDYKADISEIKGMLGEIYKELRTRANQ